MGNFESKYYPVIEVESDTSEDYDNDSNEDKTDVEDLPMVKSNKSSSQENLGEQLPKEDTQLGTKCVEEETLIRRIYNECQKQNSLWHALPKRIKEKESELRQKLNIHLPERRDRVRRHRPHKPLPPGLTPSPG